MKVDEKCLKVLAINTHKGIYKLNRLPFVLKVALSLFHQIINTMLPEIEFAMAYLDDILINL